MKFNCVIARVYIGEGWPGATVMNKFTEDHVGITYLLYILHSIIGMIDKNIKCCPSCGKSSGFKLNEDYEDWYNCRHCKLGYVIRNHGFNQDNSPRKRFKLISYL